MRALSNLMRKVRLASSRRCLTDDLFCGIGWLIARLPERSCQCHASFSNEPCDDMAPKPPMASRFRLIILVSVARQTRLSASRSGRKAQPTGAVSVSPSLCRNHVGIGAGPVAVICPYPVVIIRVRRQPGNTSTRDIADIQILVSRHVIDKSRTRSHVQAVTDRTAYAAPLRGEAGGFNLSCPFCRWSCRCGCRC
jgi:hypothetical protein